MKQVIQLILIMLVGTDVCVRMVLVYSCFAQSFSSSTFTSNAIMIKLCAEVASFPPRSQAMLS